MLLIANPQSILRIRSYVGLHDTKYTKSKNSNSCYLHGKYYAEEFSELIQKYGNIKEAIRKANPKDFDGRRKNKNKKSLCAVA